MTKMAHTSLMAYFGNIVNELQEREKDVLDVFCSNQTMTFTNCELGDELDLPDKSITGRTNRLRGLGKNSPFKDKPYLVIAEKRKCRITGFTAQAMALNPDTFHMFNK